VDGLRQEGAGDPRQPAGWLVEDERSEEGSFPSVLTVFLRNRECPWHCVFCDLWRHALPHDLVPGQSVAQFDGALAAANLAGARPTRVKLYNAGSFFDPRAIPPADHPALAERAARFERVIVECHPSLVGDRVWRFRDGLAAVRGGGSPASALEVAMGLETSDAAVLARLNKRMTPEDFARAAGALRSEGVAVRAFVLVQPPFVDAPDAARSAAVSAEFAFACGATAVSLIPVRPGNPPLDVLARQGHFAAPALGTLEDAVDAALGLARGRGRVFADLWDLERFSACSECFPARRLRLQDQNRGQQVAARVRCGRCPADG